MSPHGEFIKTAAEYCMQVYTAMDGTVDPVVLVPCVSVLTVFMAFWLK